MPARQLSSTLIMYWRALGRSPGKRAELFNAEWESLCDYAHRAIEQEKEIEELRAEIEILKGQH